MQFFNCDKVTELCGGNEAPPKKQQGCNSSSKFPFTSQYPCPFLEIENLNAWKAITFVFSSHTFGGMRGFRAV